MSYISNDDINTIRANANIVDIIGSYIPLTQKGKNYMGVCPFHDDHSPSMSVSSDKQIFKCFSCGAAGNVFTFVEKYENISFYEAVSMVADKIGMKFDKTKEIKKNNYHKVDYEIMSLALKFYQNNLKTELGHQARDYLTKRHIDNDAINEFGIGLSLDQNDNLYNFLINKNYDLKKLTDLGLINLSKNSVYDTFTRRIIFPLWDKDGNVVGFSARIYRGEEDTAKYVNSKETIIFKKGETLYNYHKAKEYIKKEKKVIIVEGFMDAIRLSLNGVKNVIALQGTALTKEQILLIKSLRVKVILCLDNDNAGEIATINNGKMLEENGLEVLVIRISGEKDPDEYVLKNGIEALKENLKNPLSYFDFHMAYLKRSKNLNNSNDLAEYINEVLKNVSESNDDILKALTIKKLAKEYDLSIDLLEKKLDNFKSDKEVLKPQIKKNVSKTEKSPYNKTADEIIYFMMNDKNYIEMYLKKLGCFNDFLHRDIANEIVYYYDKYKTINLADFITYISEKDLKDEVMRIVNDSEISELNENILEDYFKSINKLMVKDKINELKEKMKLELDDAKKIKLAEKIKELKKGSVE